MKNSIYLFCLIAIGFASCSKDSGGDSSTPVDPNPITPTVPTTFTQKVVMEIFTGAGQPQCPDGFVKIDAIVNANPTKIIPVNVHFSDGMEIPQYTTLETNFCSGQPVTYPSAMVNRTASLSMVFLNRTQWQSNSDVARVKTAKCGLSMSSTISGTTATVTVNAGFNEALTGNYSVTVYLIENAVNGTGNLYDQRNAYNTTSGHTYYGLGDPIIGFHHDNVLRKVLSAAMGDAIPSASIVAGGKETKTYSVNLTGFNSDECYIVAMINKVGGTPTTSEVLNAQKAKLGTTQNWD
ncbi:hypothetical protein BH11BAC2_BH11BAC2_13770 [soil metagenome]